MLYAETLLEAEFATYRNFPVGSAATPTGPAPAAKGAPPIGVNEPVAEATV
jgi:hypothetical protein